MSSLGQYGKCIYEFKGAYVCIPIYALSHMGPASPARDTGWAGWAKAALGLVGLYPTNPSTALVTPSNMTLIAHRRTQPTDYSFLMTTSNYLLLPMTALRVDMCVCSLGTMLRLLMATQTAVRLFRGWGLLAIGLLGLLVYTIY